MAITYKSQGAGVSTETSSAALSPHTPATVDAGDILIAHVYWEGTATTPDTPANWDLLDGPRVIETTISQHWVYGKIADGSEDAALRVLPRKVSRVPPRAASVAAQLSLQRDLARAVGASGENTLRGERHRGRLVARIPNVKEMSYGR